MHQSYVVRKLLQLSETYHNHSHFATFTVCSPLLVIFLRLCHRLSMFMQLILTLFVVILNVQA